MLTRRNVIGLYYVIEGFLDIFLPLEESPSRKAAEPKLPSRSLPEKRKGDTSTLQKLLFTVKPGGIAGYLGRIVPFLGNQQPLIRYIIASLCSTASYVDIRAKTDTYVGFLQSQSLERLLEKRPIVLLTLAKRLISLLSPLGIV